MCQRNYMLLAQACTSFMEIWRTHKDIETPHRIVEERQHFHTMGGLNVPKELHISTSMYKFYGNLEDPQRHWVSVTGLLKKGNIFIPWGVVGDMIALTFGLITYENKAPITLNAKLILRKPSFFCQFRPWTLANLKSEVES
jgi:hypothetical protein